MCQPSPMSGQYVGEFIDLYLPVFAQCDISLYQYVVMGCVFVKLGEFALFYVMTSYSLAEGVAFLNCIRLCQL
jgi:hypothetical protein